MILNDNRYQLTCFLNQRCEAQIPTHDPLERFDSIVNKLRENGNKLTPQRLAVARILALSEGHPGVEKIY